MASSIEFKKGSSLCDATFSLVNYVDVHVVKNRRLYANMTIVRNGQDYRGIAFDAIVAKAKDEQVVLVSTDKVTGAGVVVCDLAGMRDLLSGVIRPNERVVKVIIYTAAIEKIRALAKEIRTDKAVKKAANKPAKPKADLKTRRDVI